MRASVVVCIDRSSFVNRGKLYSCLSVLDVCFSCFVVAPLVVAFWSSTWSSFNFLPFAHQPVFGIVVPIAIGFSVLILFTTFQKYIQVLFTEHVGNRFIYLFSSRLYTEIFGIASVGSWYGIWTAFDTIAGANTLITVIIVMLSYIGLLCTKTARNITASPFAIITDRKQGYFDVPTLFQWSFHWKKSKLLHLLDSVFSVFIVGSLVIVIWRGAWCFFDNIIILSNDLQSAWASLCIGYALTILTFILQPFMKKLMREYNGWKRLGALNTYIVVSFCGTINVWRGIWTLLEEYTHLDKSLWISLAWHFGSFFVLVLFNASNTLLVRGIYIDADESGDECVEFPCYYFRLRFQAKQKEKTLEQLDKLNTAQQILTNRENVNDVSSWSPSADESIELTTAEKSDSACRKGNEERKIYENNELTSRHEVTHLGSLKT